MNMLNDKAMAIRTRLEAENRKDNPDEEIIKELISQYKAVMEELNK